MKKSLEEINEILKEAYCLICEAKNDINCVESQHQIMSNSDALNHFKNILSNLTDLREIIKEEVINNANS